jgi:cytochrome c-type biogenesis protein CcmH
MTRFFYALLLILPLSGWAGEAKPLADDPVVEQRMIKIAEEMRCLVCQNESLAGSHADLAEDLRREIREQIRAGKSDQEVMEFMVTRYGDFVRYRPPVKPTTWLLWFGPFVLLLIGAVVLVRTLRARNHEAPAALAQDQRQEAKKMLDELP